MALLTKEQSHKPSNNSGMSLTTNNLVMDGYLFEQVHTKRDKFTLGMDFQRYRNC